MSLHSEIDAIRRCVDEPTRAELDAVDRIIASMPALAVIDAPTLGDFGSTGGPIAMCISTTPDVYTEPRS